MVVRRTIRAMVRRPTLLLPALTVLALVLAVPVIAGGNPNAPGQQKDEAPKTPITISGTVERSTDANGKRTYTLTDGGTTYTLDAGPGWFFGDDHPLQAYVGESVTVEGEVAEGSTEVDVSSVDGTALREAGKPAWAGGWRIVGELHPGWSQDKADRFATKFGDCWPPGHCKDHGPNADDEGADSAE
jgi:hypothetical protein